MSLPCALMNASASENDMSPADRSTALRSVSASWICSSNTLPSPSGQAAAALGSPIAAKNAAALAPTSPMTASRAFR
jgi:hypothetical protein